jgi:hypothetical protein
MSDGRRRPNAAIQAAFDARRQQEDEAQHDAIMAGRRRQSALAGILGSRSPHQRRIIEIHKAFSEELARLPPNGVASFLLRYFCCEAIARILIASREGTPPHKAEQVKVSLKSLNSVLTKYQIPLDHDLINRVFAESRSPSFQNASARRLRDNIVHLFHEKAIDQIRSRGDRLLADMDNVMKALAEKADTYRGFEAA